MQQSASTVLNPPMSEEISSESGEKAPQTGPPADLFGADAFFRKNYDEAMALLIEARNYIAYQESKDMAGLSPESRLLVSQETMRVTCRITQIMAWMMCQRAWREGEIERKEALDDANKLGGESICLDDRFSADERLPTPICSLLERTYSLYVRVQRLDGLIREAAG
ncbi:MAG: DUF1465 family protein [Pseudomonadota bacterium]